MTFYVFIFYMSSSREFEEILFSSEAVRTRLVNAIRSRQATFKEDMRTLNDVMRAAKHPKGGSRQHLCHHIILCYVIYYIMLYYIIFHYIFFLRKRCRPTEVTMECRWRWSLCLFCFCGFAELHPLFRSAYVAWFGVQTTQLGHVFSTEPPGPR